MMRFEGLRAARIIAKSLRNNPEDWNEHYGHVLSHARWPVTVALVPPRTSFEDRANEEQPVLMKEATARRWQVWVHCRQQAVWLGLIARWKIKRAAKRYKIMRLREAVEG